MTAAPGAPAGGPVLALDIGGTKIAAALVHPDGRLGQVCRAATPARSGAEAVLRAAIEVGRRAGADTHPVAVGIGSAGVIDPGSGTVLAATEALPGWTGIPLAQRISAAFQVPAAALNDVHAHGLGEAAYGAGREHRDVLLVAVGTGIGGALVHDGAVLVGAHAVAGHVGHLPIAEAAGLACPCGRVGHLEALASGPALARAVRARGGLAEDGREVAERARLDGPEGDLSREVLALAAVATGRVVGGLLNVLDPDLVVLTGGVASAGPLWWEGVRAGVAMEAMSRVAATPVRPAAAGAEAALLGAARHVRGRLAAEPAGPR